MPYSTLQPRRSRWQQSKQQILRRREVERRIGLSRATIYRKIAEGTFPRPVELGARAVGWLAEDVDAWIRDRPSKRSEKKAGHEVT